MSWLESDVPSQIVIDDVTVRPLAAADAATQNAAISESMNELLSWMWWAKFGPLTVEQRVSVIEEWSENWHSKTDFNMGIFRGATCIGGTGLHLRGEAGELEIGYWVSSSSTRQGIATRVSSALVDVAFGLPEVQRVYISHDIANVASQGVPQRLGFTVLREYEREPLAPKESGHVRVWCLTRDEWSKR